MGTTHSHPLRTYSTMLRLMPTTPSNVTNEEEKVLAGDFNDCPESTLASMAYLGTFRKTTLLPVGKDRLLGTGGTIYVSGQC